MLRYRSGKGKLLYRMGLHAGTIVDVSNLDSYHSDMRSERVNIDDAQSQLANLIAYASEGGEVIIVQNGKPLARLIGATDSTTYKSLASNSARFSSDEEPLAWDADGWEELM